MKEKLERKKVDEITEQWIDDALLQVRAEAIEAVYEYGPCASADEGFGVIYKELDELLEEIKMAKRVRSAKTLVKQSVQVAAMAVRFAINAAEMAGQP